MAAVPDRRVGDDSFRLLDNVFVLVLWDEGNHRECRQVYASAEDHSP